MLVTAGEEYKLCHLRVEALCTREHGFMYMLYYKLSIGGTASDSSRLLLWEGELKMNLFTQAEIFGLIPWERMSHEERIFDFEEE